MLVLPLLMLLLVSLFFSFFCITHLYYLTKICSTLAVTSASSPLQCVNFSKSLLFCSLNRAVLMSVVRAVGKVSYECPL